MASKWEEVVDKVASITLHHMLIICDRSVSWCDEELGQLVKDCNCSHYLRIHKEFKQKIREKGKFVERNLWLMKMLTVGKILRLFGNL